MDGAILTPIFKRPGRAVVGKFVVEAALRRHLARQARRYIMKLTHYRASSTQGRLSNRVPRRIFLLSPANAAGVRGRLILNESARFDLALRLQRDGLPLGELFSFISGLYFRGKLAYARAFAQAPTGMPGAFVITPSRGLVPLLTRRDCGALGHSPSEVAQADGARFVTISFFILRFVVDV